MNRKRHFTRWINLIVLAIILTLTGGCALYHAIGAAHAIPRWTIMPEPVDQEEMERHCVMRATTGQCQMWMLVPPPEEEEKEDPEGESPNA